MVTASASARPALGARTARWPSHRMASVAAAMALVLIFLLFTGMDFLQFGPVPYFLAVFLALAIALCFPVRGWIERTAEALLGLLGAVFFVLNGAFVLPELTHPEHFPDYGLATVGLAMAGVLAVAGVAAFIPALRHPARWGSVGIALLMVVAGYAIGASAAMYGAHAQPGAATAGSVLLTPDVTVSVRVSNLAFSPAAIQVPAGKIVKIEIANADATTHNFRVDALGIAADLLAGKTTDVWIRTDKVGSYQLYCSIHSTQNADGTWAGMTGTLTVT